MKFDYFKVLNDPKFAHMKSWFYFGTLKELTMLGEKVSKKTEKLAQKQDAFDMRTSARFYAPKEVEDVGFDYQGKIVWKDSTMYLQTECTGNAYSSKDNLKRKVKGLFGKKHKYEVTKIFSLDGECVCIDDRLFLGQKYGAYYVPINYETGLPKLLSGTIRSFKQAEELLKFQPLFIQMLDAGGIASSVAVNDKDFFGADPDIIKDGKVHPKLVLERLALALNEGVDNILKDQTKMNEPYDRYESLQRKEFSDLTVKMFKEFSNEYGLTFLRKNNREKNLNIENLDKNQGLIL